MGNRRYYTAESITLNGRQLRAGQVVYVDDDDNYVDHAAEVRRLLAEGKIRPYKGEAERRGWLWIRQKRAALWIREKQAALAALCARILK